MVTSIGSMVFDEKVLYRLINVSWQENKAICIAGNIEAELGASNRLSGSEESRSGCGCAYPDYVSDYVVSNSDQIMSNFVKLTSESTIRNDQKVFKNFIFIDTNLV